MGYYINPNLDSPRKMEFFDKNSENISVEEFVEIDPGLNGNFGVCVVSNPAFDAAAIAYSKNEAKEFAAAGDLRKKRYYRVNISQIKEWDVNIYEIILKFVK